MKPTVTVIDYGIGNLFSVERALEHCGAEVRLTSDPADIAEAERLLLPGVGAFADGMRELEERGLVAPIRAFAATGRPFLGICLGMQLMLDESEEFGAHPGLGLIPGKVTAVPAVDAAGQPHKIPHIGWNALEAPGASDWAGSPLGGTPAGASAYFVHSYMAVPTDPAHVLAETRYGGQPITAALRAGSIYGCQFHPEKSGEVGLDILRNFLRL